MTRKHRWNQVYQTKASDDVSWFQIRPSISLKLIRTTGVGKDEDMIDVGDGASVPVGFLLEGGFNKPAVRIFQVPVR